jgi:hypothetical protein
MFRPKQVHREDRQKEIQMRNRFFAEGECYFEVLSVDDEAISKSSGVPMLVLELQVWDSNNKQGKTKEFITESQDWKLQDFCDSVGKSHLYEVGNNFNARELVGGSGKFYLKYKKKDDGSEDKQIRYLLPLAGNDKPQSAPIGDLTPPPFDDDIPY